MSLTWVVIAVVVIALIVFGLLLFLTDITGHEHGGEGEAHPAGTGSQPADPSKISSEFLSAVYREKQENQ